MMHFQVCFKKAFQRHSKTSELCSQFVGIILLQRILGQEETAIADTCPGWHTNYWRGKGIHSISAYGGSLSNSFAQHGESNSHSYHRLEYKQLKYLKPQISKASFPELPYSLSSPKAHQVLSFGWGCCRCTKVSLSVNHNFFGPRFAVLQLILTTGQPGH